MTPSVRDENAWYSRTKAESESTGVGSFGTPVRIDRWVSVYGQCRFPNMFRVM